MWYKYETYVAYFGDGILSIWNGRTNQELLRKKAPDVVNDPELYVQLEIEAYKSECRTYQANYEDQLRTLLTSKQYTEYRQSSKVN